MKARLARVGSCRRTVRTASESRKLRLLRFLSFLLGVMTAAPLPRQQPSGNAAETSLALRRTADQRALPPSLAQATELIDRGRVEEAAALLALVGAESLAEAADRLDKWPRAEIAKCQYFLGAYADCLNNAGPLPDNAPRHTPFGVYYYGALSASRLQLWPLVLRFTANNPEALARYLTSLGDRIEGVQVRELSLHLAVALARMDRFDEARTRLESLLRDATDERDAIGLRACIAQIESRHRRLRAKEIAPFDVQAFWLHALDSSSWWVQTQAMTLVGRRPGASVYNTLVLRLRHERWEVRDAAVRALGARGDRRAIPEIQPLLKDANVNVRAAAGRAISAIETPDG